MFLGMLKGTDCGDVIKIRVLKWGDDPGFSRWAQCHPENLLRTWEGEGPE